MPLQEDTDAYPLLIAILDSVEAELAATSEPVAHATIQTGDNVVVDYAGNGKDDCAELIVSYLSEFPLGIGFAPDDGSAGSGCSYTPGHTITIGVWRCAPEVKKVANGYKPPTPAERLNSVRVLMADKQAMKRGICKALAGREYLFTEYTAQGEDGNTVGGVWAVTVGPEK